MKLILPVYNVEKYIQNDWIIFIADLKRLIEGLCKFTF